MAINLQPVTPTWLHDALGWSVAAVSSTRIGSDRGFAGVVLRVDITPVAGPMWTVIAKVGPDSSLGEEIEFYSRYSVVLGAPAPRCYYAGAGPNGAPLLLLEDIGGGREGDALAGAPVDDVGAVLESMVPVWSYPSSRASVADLPRWGGDSHGRQARFNRNWAAQRDALSAELPPDIWRIADRLTTSLAQVAGELASADTHVVHADLHLDNVFFAGTGPIVVDWGSVRAGSPAVDIFLFISSSLSPEDQQRYGADLLDHLGLDAVVTDDGRRRLLCTLAGAIGWRNRSPTGNPREHALRFASLADGRLINALRQWDAAGVLP